MAMSLVVSILSLQVWVDLSTAITWSMRLYSFGQDEELGIIAKGHFWLIIALGCRTMYMLSM